MAKKPRLPKPWPIFFDETYGIWAITGNNAGHAFPHAAIGCQFDEHNGQRRHADHLLADAKGMYYVPFRCLLGSRMPSIDGEMRRK